MRIISGSLKGRVLVSPKGNTCRPAMGRTREALFSMLEARGVDWPKTRVLDVFAGSGSLSFEAVSRGAVSACLIENDTAVARCIADNAQRLGVGEKIRLLQDEAKKVLRRGSIENYELVFLDPPYRQSYAEESLVLLQRGWLVDSALVAVEVEKDLRLTCPSAYTSLVERRFGQTVVYILRYTADAS